MKQIIIILLLITSLFVPKNLTAQGCLSADVMILIDWSGSEQGNEEYLALASAMFVSELPINDNQLRVGILTFSNNIKNVVELTGDKEKLLKGISTLALTEASGGTDIAPAIVYAGQLLDNQRLVPKMIIIISDGEIHDVENGVMQIEYLKTVMPLIINAVKVGDGSSRGVDSQILNDKLIRLIGNTGIIEYSLPTEIVQALKRLNLCG